MIKKLFITSLALAVSATTLSGCGFTPMNAPSNIGDTTALRNISIDLIESERISDREAGYFVQQHLLDRIGVNNNAQHILKIESRSSRRPYGVTSNDVASRYDMLVTVDYSLIDKVTGEILDRGDLRAISTFGSPNDPYARITAEKTATDQVARNAADQLLIKLAAYYKNPEAKAKERKAREQERLKYIEERIKEQGYTDEQIEEFMKDREQE